MADASADTNPALPVATSRTSRLTSASVAATIIAVLLAATAFQPIWVPLALAVVGLTTALLARWSGLQHKAEFDGRLSLASALVSIPLIGYLGVMINVLLALK